MNPGSGDQALDPLINFDMGWMQQFYAAQTKLPDPGRSSTTMEMELIHTCAMGSLHMAAGTIGSWKPELDMCRNAASLINSLEATPVTTAEVRRSSCNLIAKEVTAALNTSELHKHSSAFPSGMAAERSRGSSRGSDAVKVKKKRVRPSRRVPATVVKTDTSNFKAMVEQFTGITPTVTAAEESTGAPSASSSSPQSTSSANSPSFSKPLPHPAVCKISSSPAAANTTKPAATPTCPSPLLPSSFPTCQSVPELPFNDHTPSPDDPEELTISLIDTAFFDELWS